MTRQGSNTTIVSMNSSYSITTKFQVTIPKKIRDSIGLTDKNRVSFEQRGKDIVIKKVPTIEEIAEIMHQKFVKSGRPPATDKEIKNARTLFYQQGGKW